RILKPGGVTLHLFPDRSIWREGHCGIAFAHWFPKAGRARLYHLLVFRLLGFGHFKKDLSPLQWSRDFCKWLDDWTFYRPLEEIHATFGKYFSSIRHLEERWFEARFGVSLPVALERFIVRKGGGLAIELTK